MPYRGLYKPRKTLKPMPGYISLLERLFGKKVRLKSTLVLRQKIEESRQQPSKEEQNKQAAEDKSAA